MTGNEMAEMATQEILRDLGSYEVLYDEPSTEFVVASPLDDSEGGRVDQPTAVFVGLIDEFDTVEDLVEAAKAATGRVDDLAAERGE